MNESINQSISFCTRQLVNQSITISESIHCYIIQSINQSMNQSCFDQTSSISGGVILFLYRTLANYFMWTLIKEMQDSLPSSITKLFFELEKALTGAKTEDPRWQRCLRKVESTMGMALGAILVREKFKDEDKKEVINCDEQFRTNIIEKVMQILICKKFKNLIYFANHLCIDNRQFWHLC